MSEHKLTVAEQLKIVNRISTENAISLDKGLVGQYNGVFPLTIANVGNVYYDPQTNKYYKCLVEYNGASLTAPTTDKFKEISITELENNKFEKGVTPTSLPNAEAIYKALQANIGVKFDENLLYLNDQGTKKVGLCYLDKLSDGIFECIKETTSVVNDSACFKNFSSKENSDKLGNLIKGENISFDKNIIKSSKVTSFNCAKVGNFVCGSFQIDPGEPFGPGEKLVTFPFKSKVAMRFVTGINQVQYMIKTLGDSIVYTYVNGGTLKAYDNFPFFFIIH